MFRISSHLKPFREIHTIKTRLLNPLLQADKSKSGMNFNTKTGLYKILLSIRKEIDLSEYKKIDLQVACFYSNIQTQILVDSSDLFTHILWQEQIYATCLKLCAFVRLVGS